MTVKYLSSKHAPLFIAAIVCMIFLFLPYTIVLIFSQWLLNYPGGVGVNSMKYSRTWIEPQNTNPEHGYSGSFGVSGSGDGQFINPYDIACDSINNLYIADASNYRIQVFTPDGKFLRNIIWQW